MSSNLVGGTNDFVMNKEDLKKKYLVELIKTTKQIRQLERKENNLINKINKLNDKKE